MLFQLAIITAAALMGLAYQTPFMDQLFPPLPPEQISSYSRYTYFAAAAQCEAAALKAWTCGVNCEANPNFNVTTAGGDGNKVQYWYVGYDPDQDTVIVAHQGTDLNKTFAVYTVLDFYPASLDPSLFPGIPDVESVLVHRGFLREHSITASLILDAVNQTIYAYGTSAVTTVGFSLGASLALLDAVFLGLHLPATVSINFVGYGLPRVGNEAWADLVDTVLPGGVTYINNKNDPVPILPNDFCGFRHPSGEIHIEESGDWVACPGQENPSTQCVVGAVPDFYSGNISDHNGPYDGIMMQC